MSSMTAIGRAVVLAATLNATAAGGPAAPPDGSRIVVQNRPDFAPWDADRAISGGGRQPSPHVARAALRFARKDLAGAWADLDRAVKLGSNDPDVPILRGRILLEKKDTKRAHEAFVTALKADASRHDGYLELASVYLMRGQPRNAQAILDDAVRNDPDNPEAYGNRATFYLARGQSEQALYNLDEVIRLAPGSARAYNERAWLLATCRVEKLRDPARAVESATRACELTGWKNPRYLATLAAACSEGGDFAGAVHNQQRALALVGEASAGRAEYRRLLDRYRMRKPHHALALLDEIIIRGLPAAQAAG